MTTSLRRENRGVRNYSSGKERRKVQLQTVSADSKPWECVCPKCGARHQKYLYWTGKGVPRIYCNECYTVMMVANIDDESSGQHKVGYNFHSILGGKIW